MHRHHTSPDPSRMVASVVAVLSLVLFLTPSPGAAQSLDAKIDAIAQRLIDAEPLYRAEDFRSLSETTQNIVKAIDTQKLRIQLYKMSINELKPKSSLTSEQIRWLVEIEDAFVDAEAAYRVARGWYVLADEKVWPKDQRGGLFDPLQSLSDAIKKSGEGSRKYEKAKRDLATLRARIEVQSEPK